MTPTSLRFVVAIFASTLALSAAPLAEKTPVYSGPEATATIIATLPAGTEPAASAAVKSPAGWTAVTLAGPHEVWAANKDVTKSLDVRIGAAYYTEPKADSMILTHAEKDDMAEIIDYRGKWTKFRLKKAVIGYIKTPMHTVAAPVAAPAPVAAAVAHPMPAPTPEPVAPAAPAVTTIGKAAPIGDGGSSALPRLFQGKFASTYSPFRPRRPYDFQLNDDAGARYAYVDVSKLLATELLNRYLDRTVIVYGTARAIPGSKDMVVVAESLQLR
ncbi:MAG: hypothetical protein WC205_17130 [Opitutaceae bacterium]|jgi:hypothetical protein